MEFLYKLESILQERKKNLPEKSYTSELFKQGIDRILKKVGEESAEVIIASKNPDDKELIHEMADLLFHMEMVIVSRDLSFKQVVDELELRHSMK
ncbi:MAG: phosphoribosyl-ATP diphosphatase [Leptospiraceae bacterium]|nr:phosphoribosyl-ATP diphosphatase [Leptospiraceae bacterium]MCP5511835.1 phosphoribosyl-ATP diphosphatase [Leptospiraceae bacterium]